MARPATSVSARIRSLEGALVKAGQIPFGETVTFTPMREMLGISAPVLRGWCNEIEGFDGSGAFLRGDRGIEWAFNPVATVLFLLRHFEAEQARAAEKSRRVREIVAGDELDHAPDGMGLEDLTRMIRLNTELQQSKIRDGQLTDAGRAAAAFSEYATSIQQALMRAAQEQDPGGDWPPEVREKFEDAMRNILVRAAQSGQDCLNRLRDGSAA